MTCRSLRVLVSTDVTLSLTHLGPFSVSVLLEILFGDKAAPPGPSQPRKRVAVIDISVSSSHRGVRGLNPLSSTQNHQVSGMIQTR